MQTLLPLLLPVLIGASSIVFLDARLTSHGLETEEASLDSVLDSCLDCSDSCLEPCPESRIQSIVRSDCGCGCLR